MAKKAVPVAKQCTDESSHLFGAVAVQAADNRWGVMHPVNGGHWAGDTEVESWAPLTP